MTQPPPTLVVVFPDEEEGFVEWDHEVSESEDDMEVDDDTVWDDGTVWEEEDDPDGYFDEEWDE